MSVIPWDTRNTERRPKPKGDTFQKLYAPSASVKKEQDQEELEQSMHDQARDKMRNQHRELKHLSDLDLIDAIDGREELETEYKSYLVAVN